MHGMVAGQWQSRNDRFGTARRRDRVVRQFVADDTIVRLRVEAAVIERDAGPAVSALREGSAEADRGIRLAVAVVILQGHEEAARRRRVVAVVAAAPGVDVDHPVRSDDEVPGVADVVGDYGRAEPGR